MTEKEYGGGLLASFRGGNRNLNTTSRLVGLLLLKWSGSGSWGWDGLTGWEPGRVAESS